MKKDVIYIDIEDDITSIIDKVHQAENKIVALVPPKRAGALQSAVNLKLLQKAADTDGKRLVLITSDNALVALAAGVRMPIARNLQSKPEMASAQPPRVEDEDIINGDELPVGELAKASGISAATSPIGLSAAAKQASEEIDQEQPKKFTALAAAGPLKKGGMKIPNFESFRKRLFIIGAIVIALIVFLVWALMFAPRATVTVTAKTEAVDIQKDLILDPGAEPDISLGRLKPEVKLIKKTQTAEFDATGSKEIGERASGSMTLTNASDSENVEVPAGTTFTAANGLVFTSSAAVSVPGARVSGGRIVAGTATVAVTAQAIGPEYNLAAQEYESNSENISAAGGQMNGGSRETVKVVSQADINKASQQLGEQDDDAARKELEQQFGGDFVLIKESFEAKGGQPAPDPAVGERADKGRLTVETTYTLVGLERKQLKSVMDEILNDSIDEGSQLRIYSSGDQDVRFSEYQGGEGDVSSVRMNTTGHIGPSIDADELAGRLVGKRYGEIEQIVNGIEGVEKVDIDFSPFWVGKAPSEDKITVRFDVKTDASQ